MKFLILIFGVLLATAGSARADFAVALSPPRFEVETEAGSVVRRMLEISNAGTEPVRVSIRTADWVFEPGGAVTFFDELQPGSCRPWVAIERREVTVRPGRPFRLRFEVTPPPGTPAVECRFALLVEGKDSSIGKAGDISIPYTGRLAAIVYIGVGGVKPELSFVGSEVRQVNGEPTPVLLLHNSGSAHGRPRGLLSGTDAGGVSIELTPSGEPVMPGETRAISLVSTKASDPGIRVVPRPPITAKGTVDWLNGKSIDIDARFPP
jgi:hypothetical protein